ncbi:MAG: hypothetical protein U0835_22915 [Isosphaeraceae bacterium]
MPPHADHLDHLPVSDPAQSITLSRIVLVARRHAAFNLDAAWDEFEPVQQVVERGIVSFGRSRPAPGSGGKAEPAAR